MPPRDPSPLATEELFHRAVNLEKPDREEFLANHCVNDPERARQVLRLLDAHDAAGDFLAVPAHPRSHTTDPALALGTQMGPYVLEEVLGEGGFGIVYGAKQLEPVKRQVALKVIKLGMDTHKVLRRFELEQRALGSTDHPYIVKVLDAGVSPEGRPFFVMERIHGPDLCTYSNQHHLSLSQRLELFIKVCRGVQHAHQKGLIHRDLKPSNVLVVEEEGHASPRLIDFGVAKALQTRSSDESAHTEAGQYVGTPAYMSPEQAGVLGLDVDTRADVYSLGAILYELISGHAPFSGDALHGKSIVELQDTLAHHAPVPPSERLGDQSPNSDVAHIQFKRDLDWIVMCTLEKNRDQRYSSVEALAADIERYLNHKPIEASAPSFWERTAKFVRRHHFPVAVVSAALFALIVSGTGALWAWREAVNQRISATRRSEFVEQLLAGSIPSSSMVRAAESAFGDNHAAVAAALELGATQLQARGDLPGAIELASRAFNTWVRVLGNVHIRVAEARARWGHLLYEHGQLDKALSQLEACLLLASQTGDDESALAASPFLEARMDLAALYRRRGDLGLAADQLRDVARLRRAHLPSEQDALGRTLETLGEVLTSAGLIQESATVRRQMLAAFQRAYPEGGLAAADRQLVFGAWLHSTGLAEATRLGDAESHLRAGLEFYARVPHLQGSAYLTGLLTLAALLESKAPTSPESFSLLEQALTVAGALHGTQSFEYARLEVQLARACVARGLEARAVRLHTHAAKVQSQALGKDYRPAASLMVLGDWAAKIAQRADATLESYELAIELAALMMLYAPDSKKWRSVHDMLVEHSQGKSASPSIEASGS